jgi:ketosteroid isomerase-like protein
VASHNDILGQVRRANERFYRAFESLDMQLMAAMWMHTDHARCVHPGWGLLEGWPAIRDSWQAIFANTDSMRFVITDVSVHLDSHVAWVTCTENLSDSPDARAMTRILATNIYQFSDDDWLLVHHHASPILRPSSPAAGPGLEDLN